ncbi:RanGTP-binding protein-domain-containing protein [Parachaetomium inaequale]|uniref:RanGTP-binding protein-domain-containing protein n=1 Tax=Parachaetomium inaequale TaxID=2588326 RepID=A0AAN6SVY6_9PEZI|nr:RanGTP-binding protein-domain-containing protein [Parachaetomium inaequale]
MDALLQTLGAQTVSFAIRSGLALTSRYAVQQCSRLLKSVNDRAVRAELKALQKLLDSRIKILSPALDLIEFKSSRGNVFLESAVPLAKSLHREIIRLGKRLDNAATAEEDAHDAAADPKGRGGRVSEAHHAGLLLIIRDIKDLLARIDRDIPLLQFAITVSGEKMSTTMTPGISPSRMMQASALLSFADAHFAADPSRPMQTGPSFTLSLYMLFLGHSQVGTSLGPGDVSASTPPASEDHVPRETPYGLGEGERKPIWQEVMHKARVRLCRIPANWAFDPSQGYGPDESHGSHFSGAVSPRTTVPLLGSSDGYSYHLEIIEDLDDGRLHDGDGSKPRPYDDLPMAGIRESIPIHQISKIFYTDTGRILNIGNNDERDNNPVLLLKRDVNAKCPIKMRQEWFDEPEPKGENESQSDTADESSEPDDQDDVDRQLWEETEHSAKSPASQDSAQATYLPPHLDTEWLALEVYAEDDGGEDEDEEEDQGDGGGSDHGVPQQTVIGSPQALGGLSVDSKLMAQVQRISLRSASPPQDLDDRSLADLQKPQEDIAENYVSRAPFGSITSSLSLLEMLIRLTSLQEFQQTSHLAIPDHILTFFLEETSTTGLHGEAHWRMRSEAKRRMGFDPYTDTVPRQDGE